jgi:hypothetical protein
MTVLENAKIWEGTWEEVATHAAEFQGRHVQLTVFNGATGTVTANAVSVADLIGDIVGGVSFLPNDLSERHSEALSEILEDKRRAGRL